MKKSKVLIGTLALATALMGTGYAYWTQELKVDTTVETAKFKVWFSDAGVSQSDPTPASPNNTAGLNNSYNTLELKTKTDTALTYSWTNIYPGSDATFNFTIKNDSTIPVHAKPEITATIVDKEQGAVGAADDLLYTVTIGEGKGKEEITKTSLTELETALEALDKTIPEGGTLPVSVKVEMKTDVTDIDAANDKITFNVSMIWGQFNDGNPTKPQETSKPSETPAPTEEPAGE